MSPTLRRYLVALLLLALTVVWIVVLVSETGGDASAATDKAFGHLTAALILALFTLCIRALGRSVAGLVLGKDKRISTSKLQIALWTYAIGFGLLSLIAMTWVGLDAGFDALTDPDFDFEDYLFLLGGPFAAAVSARYLIGAKVEHGELAKPEAEDGPSLGQAFSNDEGTADLVDTQYLLFNIVALVYFLGAFFSDPTEGFPDIPTLLFSLTSVSAATYVANKAVARGVPAITGVFPQKARLGDVIDVFGMYLLFPKEVDTAGVTTYHDVSVTVGGLRADVVAGSLRHSSTGDDRLQVTVPAGLAVGRADVKVLNFRGVETPAKEFEVLP